MTELMEAVGEVLQAFEDGYFVRTTKYDHESDWAIKLFGPLRSLGKLKVAYDNELVNNEQHQTGCICADCSGAELTADND